MVLVTPGERLGRVDVVPAPAPPALPAPTTHQGWVTLTPLSRPDLAVRCELISAVKRSGLSGLWEDVTRPGRQSSQDYVGQGLERQAFTVLFEGAPPGDGAEPASVQGEVNRLLALLAPLPGEYAPPLLNLDGPVQGRRGARQWQLQAAEENGDPLRREADGYVWQVAYDLTLALYVPTTTLTVAAVQSPAAAADAAAKAKAGGTAPAAPAVARTYTVRAGDTLSRIAQRELASASRWRELATLNGLANPNVLRVGQVLRLP